MSWRNGIRERAKKALDKPPKYGIDVDVTNFIPKKISINVNLSEYSNELSLVGIDVSEKERMGSFYQFESQIIKAIAKHPGVELMSLEDAIDEYGKDILEWFWNAVPVDQDKFTAIAELKGKGGYFIRVKKGVKLKIPIQACLLMREHGSLQAPHNIIIAEEGSEVNVITGCMMMRETIGLHAGVTEIYIDRKARVNYVMIHKWSRAMYVYPRTGVIVKEGGEYVSHYIAFTALKALQALPKVVLYDAAHAYLSSILALEGDAKADTGYVAYLQGNNASVQIVSRSITKDNAEIIARGKIIGKTNDVKGHIDCQGLLLSTKSRIVAVPQLIAESQDVSLTHEAAIGKLGEEKIIWLMARGFSREEAESILIRGFMSVDITGLPKNLAMLLKGVLKMIAKSVV